jgi:DNA-binding CsgD family transcriptional regulator
MANERVLERLAEAISSIGTQDHVNRLIDLIGELVPHDLITVVRYSASHRPEFVSHRRFSDVMVRKYLDIYYVYDPFYAFWREKRRPGIIPLRTLTTKELKRGQYIAEFLGQSVIRDEVGVLVEDGEDWCLGIFLDRKSRDFSKAEVEHLALHFPIFSALHALDIKTRRPGFLRTDEPTIPGRKPPTGDRKLPADLWPSLSARERELVELVLAGHPSATIATRLKITVGTVKNHRRRIYDKLDITTERELFLQYFERL